jgi:hypothetical protein
MQIFGGLLANLKEMGAWLSWIQYLSIVRYCLSVSHQYWFSYFM